MRTFRVVLDGADKVKLAGQTYTTRAALKSKVYYMIRDAVRVGWRARK